MDDFFPSTLYLSSFFSGIFSVQFQISLVTLCATSIGMHAAGEEHFSHSRSFSPKYRRKKNIYVDSLYGSPASAAWCDESKILLSFSLQKFFIVYFISSIYYIIFFCLRPCDRSSLRCGMFANVHQRLYISRQYACTQRAWRMNDVRMRVCISSFQHAKALP